MDWQWELFQLDNPLQLQQRARQSLKLYDHHAAATALDRAYGLDPSNRQLARERQQLLDHLAREQDGVIFRYVPGGVFLMGSATGDPDERPVHPVCLESFWIAETPVDWVWISRVLGYPPPPLPPRVGLKESFVWEIRHQYCEDHTHRASDWHNHYFEAIGESGWPYRPDRKPQAPGYDLKPAVAVHLDEALKFCALSQTRLPSEAEWEKAARGGLIQKPYSWGDPPPTPELCDFHRFEDFSLRPSRQFPPNGYGLYSMCGGVWEWTSTPYDALAYRGNQPATGAKHYVVRGGCWADCAETVTVSFRNSRPAEAPPNANQGLRVCLGQASGGIPS